MIQLVNHSVDRLFELFEIDPHAKLVKLGRADCYLNFPVVTMGILAVARIGPQMMAARKMSFDENVHKKSNPQMFGVEALRRDAIKAACTEIISNGKQFLFLVHRFARQT